MLLLLFASALSLIAVCIAALVLGTVTAWLVAPALACAVVLGGLTLLGNVRRLRLPPLAWTAAPLGAFLVALWIYAMISPLYVPRWLNLPMLVTGLFALVVGATGRRPLRTRRAQP